MDMESDSIRVTPTPFPIDRLRTGLEGEPPVRITCIDYCVGQIQVREIKDLHEFVTTHRPHWTAVRWINVDGLDKTVLERLGEKYQLHPLAVEDVATTKQRPKVEDFPKSGDNPGRLYIVARMLERDTEEKDKQGECELRSEQLNIFMGRNTLITFQETPGDAFDNIRHRLRMQESRIRQNDASFLLYALFDAIIDGFFPFLEQYHEKLEALEEEIFSSPSNTTLGKIHQIKRDLIVMRRAAWPMRDVISDLLRERHECLSETTRTYFRDVYDHCVQIIDLIETYREIAGDLTETYMSVVSYRMNEVMKVLTILGTIFIPLTFLAGVYGMNMPIPENDMEPYNKYTYPAFWVISIITATTMLYIFRRRGWF